MEIVYNLKKMGRGHFMTIDNEQYKIIVESSPNMIWRSGKDAQCDYFNTTWLNFTGKTMEQEVGNGWVEGVHPDDLDACVKTYLESFEQRKPFEMEYRLKRHDNEWRWINDRGVPIYDHNGEFYGYIGSCMDVTGKVEGEKLREMAQNDGLTGIYNRQYFEQLARVQFEKAKQTQVYLSLVMIDIDKFKLINDIYGHHAGDMVLQQVALILQKSVRNSDILGRYGGDEFVILMLNTKYEEAIQILNNCQDTFNNLDLTYDQRSIKVSISYGIKQMDDEERFEKLIVDADKKLYEMKAIKKNKY